MQTPIVVGVDPVREDPAPVALAAVLADLTGAPVVAVAAHPLHTMPTGLVPPGYDALMRDRAQSALKRAQGRLPAGAASRAVAARSLAGALHEVACEVEAGLLVVGRAHRGRMGRILAGSVADGVLDGAACPVASPRPDTRPRATWSGSAPGWSTRWRPGRRSPRRAPSPAARAPSSR